MAEKPPPGWGGIHINLVAQAGAGEPGWGKSHYPSRLMALTVTTCFGIKAPWRLQVGVRPRGYP